MTSRRRCYRLSTPLALALLVALWIALAPIQLGGRAAFVIVNGNSMEPLYHRGDLVIARAASDYQVDDIVTYRHPQIGPVIHRIIGRDGERWIFKGDHNNFVDAYRPVQAELIGRSWIYLPAVGSALNRLRTPLAMVVFAMGVGVIIMGKTMIGSKRRGPRKRGPRLSAGQRAGGRAGGLRESLLAALALLALAFLALAGFAFTLPSVRDVSEDLAYQQSGEFSYSAAAPPDLYDAPGVQSGEPVFRQLSKALIVDFSYRLESDAAADLHGTGRLVAQLSTLNGWKRTIELQPEQSFRGGAFAAHGVLDFAQVQALVERLERQTGLERQQYVLAIVPEVRVEGTLAGQALRDKFAPHLEFRLDEFQLQLLKDGRDMGDPLKPAQSGLLKRTRAELNTIALLGLPLAVLDARPIALIGLALALAGAGALGVSMFRAMRCDEAARIRLKYGALLVDSVGGAQPAGARVIELATIDDLAKLAEKHSSLILHEAVGPTHRYLVHDTAAAYLYQLGGDAAGQPDARAPVVEMPPPWTIAPAVPQLVRKPDSCDHTLDSAAGPAAPEAHWQSAFLAALREKGRAAEACRAIGISIASAYLERERVPAFAQAWAEAQVSAKRRW